jgi:2-polyprenyl-3-methyl-5-hydroxy-6-metoxy-1,4-benzoquinol methylase
MTRWLVDAYSRVIATDVADAALQSCRARMPKDVVELVRTDAAHVALRDDFADMVVAFDLVEHLPEPDRCFAEAHRLLRPGGVIFLSTPNPASLGARIKGRYPEYRGLPLAKRKKQWFGWQDDSHVSILTIETWRKKLAEAGFKVVADGSDYWWDAPYVTWLPAFPQEAVCKVLQRVFTRIRYFIPWQRGENYIAIARKVVA